MGMKSTGGRRLRHSLALPVSLSRALRRLARAGLFPRLSGADLGKEGANAGQASEEEERRAAGGPLAVGEQVLEGRRLVDKGLGV